MRRASREARRRTPGWSRVQRQRGAIEVDGYPAHAYYRTHDYSKDPDPDWFMHGLSEPGPLPERFFEWHERGWVDPGVQVIRGAITEAADRVRSRPMKPALALILLLCLLLAWYRRERKGETFDPYLEPWFA